MPVGAVSDPNLNLRKKSSKNLQYMGIVVFFTVMLVDNTLHSGMDS